MLVADRTTGRYAGRLYMSVLYGSEYNLGVFRSEDDGRSWIGPVKFIDGGGERGLFVDPMLVFHDGAIMAPFVDFPFTTEQMAEGRDSRIWTVVSVDGGVSFSEPKRGPVKMTGEHFREMRAGAERFRGGSWVVYAVDRGERFRDRAYAMWPDYSEGPPRVVVSSSDDRGTTWSEPRKVAPAGARTTEQFQPAIAVNRDGIVGVTWYDTRDAPAGEFAFHEYFAASLDGGETFTEPHRVSSALSRPVSSGNLRWQNGGDYMGLAVSADGHFHPVWADARSGTYQVYTAEVRIEYGDAPAPTERGGAPT